MDFLACVQTRRSIRKYKQEPVPNGVIERVISAATFSPSWKNAQTARYVVVRDADLKNELAEKCSMGFEFNKNTIKNAPAIVLLTTVSSRSGYERDGSFSTSKGTHWESFDAGIAAQTLCLAAHAEGLGTVILGIFDEDKVVKAANIPEGEKLSARIAIGYPGEAPNMPKRKAPQDITKYIG